MRGWEFIFVAPTGFQFFCRFFHRYMHERLGYLEYKFQFFCRFFCRDGTPALKLPDHVFQFFCRFFMGTGLSMQELGVLPGFNSFVGSSCTDTGGKTR